MSSCVAILQEQGFRLSLDLMELVDREDVLVLTLGDADGRCVQVRFDSYVAYRKLDEGDALLTRAAMRRSGGTGKYFYRVEDSDLGAWFHAERCVAGPKPVVRYAV